MVQLLNRFFALCLFQASPQDLPRSPFLLSMSLLVYALIGLIMALNQAHLLKALAMVGIEVGLMSGLCWLLLWIRQIPYRYTQTLTAMAGCSALLALLALPILLWQQSASSDDVIVLAALLMWLLLLWQIMMFSHIIRHALSTSFLAGTTLVLIYMYITNSFAQALFYQDAL